MTGTRKKVLERVLYIHYLIQFKKDRTQVQALVDLGSEVNTIHPSFAKQLDLSIRSTDVGAQKIDSTMQDTHEIVVAAFSVVEKANQIRFFQETFLVANVSPEIVFGMSFFILSGADIDFSGWELW